MWKQALVVFTKVPIAGEVKTRLCPPLKPKQSAMLCSCFLKDITEHVKDMSGIHRFICYTPRGRRRDLKSISKYYKLVLQRGKKLGDKLYNLFKPLFTKGFKAIVLI